MLILRTQLQGLTIVGLACGLELFVWEKVKMAKFKRKFEFIKNPNGSR